MPFWRFTVLTLIGCIPWVLALGVIGDLAKANWTTWKHDLQYLDYAVVAVVVIGIVLLMIRWWRRRGSEGEPAADAPL
jgi:membrane protein DedA with SNARE-associated domain